MWGVITNFFSIVATAFGWIKSANDQAIGEKLEENKVLKAEAQHDEAVLAAGAGTTDNSVNDQLRDGTA